MSRKKKRRSPLPPASPRRTPRPREREREGDGLWVVSDRAPDGTYVVTVSVDADLAVTLNREQAVAYCLAVVDVAGRAEYDSAILRQMENVGVSLDAAVQVVTDLRQDRPGLDAVFGPFRFEPVVSNRTGEPVVAIHGPRAQAAQIAAGDAKLHAVHVLEALAVADLDAGYLRLLRSLIGLDDARARQVVDDLGRWRP